MSEPSRRLWQLAEPCHALTYFDPDVLRAFEDRGFRGFWRGYFAGRATPLGQVGPNVVTACFFGFHPAFVARAVPGIWALAEPCIAIEARLAGVDAALRRLVDVEHASAAMLTASTALRGVLERCPTAGRPLFAANLELAWPELPHLMLWHAATLLREHRGDGHIVALTAVGLDPCEAHVTRVSASGEPPETIQPYRGWTAEDWELAAERLRRRGWMADAATLTTKGREGRARVEETTDRLAAKPVELLGPERFGEVCDTFAFVTRHIVQAGAIPFPNPMGVPPLQP